MCSSPKAPKAPEEKPVQYLRNPYLDGITIGGGTAQGRNALRIEPGSSSGPAIPPGGVGIAPPPSIPRPTVPGLIIPTPRGGGSGNGRGPVRVV